jgi:hypothetical protein
MRMCMAIDEPWDSKTTRCIELGKGARVLDLSRRCDLLYYAISDQDVELAGPVAAGLWYPNTAQDETTGSSRSLSHRVVHVPTWTWPISRSWNDVVRAAALPERGDWR